MQNMVNESLKCRSVGCINIHPFLGQYIVAPLLAAGLLGRVFMKFACLYPEFYFICNIAQAPRV